MKTDTIAAIATAISDSGIGIIRISGEESLEIADKLFRNKNNERLLKNYKSHTIHYGYIVDKNENLIDEVMVSVFKAPNSYTTEDTVEINCHGGALMVKKILTVVMEAGARIAEPGEFTKRAFLNGRIDLSKAEAIMDLIHAKNEFALCSSVKQLKGSVSNKIKQLRDTILYEIAFIESALDDPEHVSLDGYTEKLSQKIDDLLSEIKKLLKNSDNGKILKEGINTVIMGKPNAGKSSLLNVLMGEERAIVTEIAGTTRDILEETIKLGEVSLNIIDTAGIRNTKDVVEKIGVEKAKTVSRQADLVLYVIDTSIPLDENDEEIIRLIDQKNTIIIFNKSDLTKIVDIQDLVKKMDEILKKKITIRENNEHFELSYDKKNIKVLEMSTKQNVGIDDLVCLIKDMYFDGDVISNDEIYITNMRHKEALMEADESLLQVKKSLEDDMPEDFYSIDLMSAYSSLGRIIGEEVGDDLVNEIFSKFCMGK